MRIKPISRITTLALLAILVLSGTVAPAGHAAGDPILATAKGKGTIKVGSETFQISSVVVKLLDDGTAEITLVSEITFFLSGKWTSDSTSPKSYNLQITGSVTGGGAQGTGKVVMRDDGTSLDRLTVQGGLKTSPRKVSVDFVADK
jgi:hypothetical protein